MGRRLYYGELLRHIQFYPAYAGEPCKFRLQMVIDYKSQVYTGSTIESIIAQVKASGHIVWGGTDPIDYAKPDNALELVLMREHLEKEGMPKEEMERWLGLVAKEEES